MLQECVCVCWLRALWASQQTDGGGFEGEAWTGQKRLRAPGVWGLGMLGTLRVL